MTYVTYKARYTEDVKQEDGKSKPVTRERSGYCITGGDNEQAIKESIKNVVNELYGGYLVIVDEYEVHKI